ADGGEQHELSCFEPRADKPGRSGRHGFRSPVIPKHGYIDEYISVANSGLLYIDADSMMSASKLSFAGIAGGRGYSLVATV
ncbi:MAG TPA: hypothetical protein VK624_18720, partial [Steroidobacteraceae bacterium]|nr:hypothetical protein [Steroidobacteraceae bacterium]